MKHQITFALILISFIGAVAQNVTREDLEKQIKPLTEKIKTIQSDNGKLKAEIGNLNTKLSNSSARIDNLKNQIEVNAIAIAQTKNELGIQIKETGEQTAGEINKVSDSLSKNSLYGIIGVLSAILLSGLLYWLLRKRQKTDKTDFNEKFASNKASIKSDVISEIEKSKKEQQEVNVKLEQKLIDILENQIKGIKSIETNINETEDKPIDHSMPLKVADEITRINAYANSLDPNSQDAKALKSSVKRLINTFKAEQYEIIDLLGQKYDDGMKVTVINEVEDINIPQGERRIIRIIKPQVKFNNEQIQAAQVDIAHSILP